MAITFEKMAAVEIGPRVSEVSSALNKRFRPFYHATLSVIFGFIVKDIMTWA